MKNYQIKLSELSNKKWFSQTDTIDPNRTKKKFIKPKILLIQQDKMFKLMTPV